jgi:hypothetical protein
MSKYGFKDLEALYENVNLASNPYADKNYSPGSSDVWGPKNSYGTKGMIPTTVPGNAGTAYSMNQTNSNNSFSSFSEEEDERVIPIYIVKQKINDLLTNATDRDVVTALSELLISIDSSDNIV